MNHNSKTLFQSHSSIEIKKWVFVLVLAASAWLLFYQLGYRSLWGSEGRWGEIAKEMIGHNNYFVPTIDNVDYAVKKPLISYWLVCLASKINGNISEWQVRLPSAVSGFISILLLYFIGKKLFDSFVGILASSILGTTFYFVFWSKIANADTLTLALFLATILLFIHCKENKNHSWLLMLYALMGLNSNVKGLLGFVLPMVVFISYSIFSKNWKWFLNFTTPIALLSGVFIFLIPPALSSCYSHTLIPFKNIIEENFLRYVTPFDHKNPFYYYFYTFIPLFAPWILFFPNSLIQAWKERKNRNVLFTIVLFSALFLFFLFSKSRRLYYLLPSLPGASLLVALFFKNWVSEKSFKKTAFIPITLFLSLIFLLALSLIFADNLLIKLPELSHDDFIGFIFLISFALLLFLFYKNKKRTFITSSIILVYIINLFVWSFGIQYLEQFRLHKSSILHANSLFQYKDQPKNLYLYHLNENDMFYLNRDFKKINSDQEMASIFNSKENNWFLITENGLNRVEPKLNKKYSVIFKQEKLNKPYSFVSYGKRYLLISNSPTTSKN